MNLIDFENQPFIFLEGGTGLNSKDEKLSKYLFEKGYDIFVLDNLYEKPKKIGALKFLDPKTIFLGTTGLRVEKLNTLIDLFFSLEIKSVKNIIFTMRDNKGIFWDELKKIKKQIPTIKFYELEWFDTDDTSVRLVEIETND